MILQTFGRRIDCWALQCTIPRAEKRGFVSCGGKDLGDLESTMCVLEVSQNIMQAALVC
jgi:hypothetical protein